jgi:hypothetical protein
VKIFNPKIPQYLGQVSGFFGGEYWEHDEASEGGKINFFAFSSEMALTSIAIE